MLAQKLMGAKVSAGGGGFVSVSSATGSASGADFDVGTPSGAVAGDLLVAVGVMSRAPASFPVGWTVALNASNRFIAVGTHDGVSTAYGFGSTSSYGYAAAILCFRAYAYGVTGAISAGVQDPVAPSITTVEPFSDLVAFASSIATGHTWSPPAGWTSIVDLSSASSSLCVALKDAPVGAGATATVAFTRTSGASTLNRAVQLSVHPT